MACVNVSKPILGTQSSVCEPPPLSELLKQPCLSLQFAQLFIICSRCFLPAGEVVLHAYICVQRQPGTALEGTA